MTPVIVVTPSPATPGDQLDVRGSGFTVGVPVGLTTVNDLCVEVGGTSFRPKRDGSFGTGIPAPKVRGLFEVHAKQRGVVVAKFRGSIG